MVFVAYTNAIGITDLFRLISGLIFGDSDDRGVEYGNNRGGFGGFLCCGQSYPFGFNGFGGGGGGDGYGNIYGYRGGYGNGLWSSSITNNRLFILIKIISRKPVISFNLL